MARPNTATRRLCAGYLALQALLGVGFWLIMASSASWRAELELMPSHAPVTDAFAVADILGVVLASAAGAFALDSGRPWAVPAVWFAASGIVYPTLYLFGWVAFSPSGTGGILLFEMCVVSTATCWVAVQTWRLFKPSSALSPGPAPAGGDATGPS